MGSLGTMGVLGDVRGVLLAGELRKSFGRGGVGVLVTSARTVLDGWVVPGWSVRVLEGLGEAVFVGLRGNGPASSILVQVLGLQPW